MMMKRMLAFALAAILLLCTGAALADANLKTVEKNLIVYDGDDNGYFFAKIENVSTEGVYVDYGNNLVIFDDSDEILVTKPYVNTCPSSVYLEPGEYAYVKEFLWDSALEGATVSDYKFTPVSDDRGSRYAKLESEARLEYNGSGSYDNYIYVTFTNTTEAVLYDYYITAAIRDADGNLVFVDDTYSTTFGIHPGGTVTIKLYIDGDMCKYYTAHKVVPTTVESIVYMSED